jgi:hypothetical protein
MAVVRTKAFDQRKAVIGKEFPARVADCLSHDEQSDTDDGKYLIETPSRGTPNG